MYLKSISFNHDAENIHDAFNISPKKRMKSRERVFFCSFANYLQATDLFEDENDAPLEFKTKTGDLARTLQLISDPSEYEYTLIMFMKLQDMATDATAKYKLLNDSNADADNLMKLKIVNNILDLMGEKEKKENPTEAEFVITPSSMNRRIEMVKASRCNWETYYNMITAEDFFSSDSSNSFKKSAGSDFDVDDMLKNILGDN